MTDPTETDVVIVGARCAGAALAIHLRRRGKRVIVVDSAAMPSDQPISTHLVSPHGMASLDELGLGAAVRAIAPPLPSMVNAMRTRDVVACELFHFAADLGDPAYNTPFTRMIYAKMKAHPWVRDNIVGIHRRTLEPSLAFPTKTMVSWTIGELFRGNFAIWKPFLAAGKRGGEVAKEKALRTRLAEEAARAVKSKERQPLAG